MVVPVATVEVTKVVIDCVVVRVEVEVEVDVVANAMGIVLVVVVGTYVKRVVVVVVGNKEVDVATLVSVVLPSNVKIN
ncbi:hypothetical protein A0J61_00588 [Choanephora cucurbitarum]|uniref:Uncharacterized protein n=1 Tax=Choanephora cucurbitarum TaxID=101091 RepID=A0A1C7NQZ9_9FUNG|nr:hypothetical protein A0J61_00588 [Choanephora cucurbitarum]